MSANSPKDDSFSAEYWCKTLVTTSIPSSYFKQIVTRKSWKGSTDQNMLTDFTILLDYISNTFSSLRNN